jgi:hypothetical protein
MKKLLNVVHNDRLITLQNNACRKMIIIPEGNYNGKTFCEMMNKICNNIKMIYHFYYGKYPTSQRCEILKHDAHTLCSEFDHAYEEKDSTGAYYGTDTDEWIENIKKDETFQHTPTLKSMQIIKQLMNGQVILEKDEKYLQYSSLSSSER